MSIPTDALFDFITSKVHLTSKDKQSITDKLSLEVYNKDAIIVKQEQVCTSLRFVVSGVYL